MRIAQVAPLYESVPPKRFANDCTSNPRVPAALRLNPRCVDQLAHHVNLVTKLLQQREEFDLIHFHEKLTAPMKVLEKLGEVTVIIN